MLPKVSLRACEQFGVFGRKTGVTVACGGGEVRDIFGGDVVRGRIIGDIVEKVVVGDRDVVHVGMHIAGLRNSAQGVVLSRGEVELKLMLVVLRGVDETVGVLI